MQGKIRTGWGVEFEVLELESRLRCKFKTDSMQFEFFEDAVAFGRAVTNAMITTSPACGLKPHYETSESSLEAVRLLSRLCKQYNFTLGFGPVEFPVIFETTHLVREIETVPDDWL